MQREEKNVLHVATLNRPIRAEKEWDDHLEQTAAHHDPRRPPYVINWSVLQLQGSPAFVMADPFHTQFQESRNYCAERSSRPTSEPLSNKQVL